jgi:hypothetical protein
VTHRCTVKRTSTLIVAFPFIAWVRQTVLSTARGIQMLFLLLAFRALIIFDASAYGILAAVSIPAAERTTNINAAGIAWVGEKQDLTMPASGQVWSQMGLFLENRSNNPVILRDDTTDLFLAVPVRNTLKTRLNMYYKKANCSLMSLMYLGIPSLSFFCLAIN